MSKENLEQYYSVVDFEIKRMETILEQGLNPVYDDFDDFLYDYFPDFSWVPSSADVQLKELLASEEWCNLAARILEKHKIDFVKAINLAISEVE